MQSKCGDTWRMNNPNSDPMKWVNGRLFAYGDVSNLHKSCWDKWSLQDLFKNTGFTEIHPLLIPRGYDHGNINLGIGGFKK